MANQRSGPVSLVIFDCDGVLVDSEPVVIRILTAQLQALGIDITYEQCTKEFVGLSQDATVRLISNRLGAEIPPGWLDDLILAVDQALRTEVRPVAGVVDVLAGMSVPFCVASNGRPAKLAVTLGASGLIDYFEDRIFTAADVLHGKPAPDLFLLAAARMGTQPARCVVVEDSASGVAAGQAAGMRVRVRRGGRPQRARARRHDLHRHVGSPKAAPVDRSLTRAATGYALPDGAVTA